jgi:perosamine synthetase
MSVPDTVRHGSAQVIFESYPTVGYNYRMTDIQAAVGREQIKRLASIVAERRMLAERYRGLLRGMTGVTVPQEPAWARSNWQSYAVRLDPRIPQQAVMQAMLDACVSTRRGIMCAHREPAYADVAHGPLPASESVQQHCVLLPLYNGMTAEQQEQVVRALHDACATVIGEQVARAA